MDSTFSPFGKFKTAYLAGVAAILCAVGQAAGNGKAFPAVAYPDIPRIPAQRAIVSWRDGVETLVVESTVDSPSPDIGWVLPLPTEPTELGLADAGTLISMSMSQGPEVLASAEIAWGIALCVLVLLATWAVTIPFPKLTIPMVIVFVVLFIWFMVQGTSAALTFGEAGSDTAFVEGVSVSSTQRLGSYDATILRADAPEVLDRWLTGNGLRGLDSDDRRVIADYIARKWCFMVAVLRKDDKLGTPHPIRATFPIDKPVFPMKLTGLAGSKTRVELFVISDRQATTDGFVCTTAARYRRRKPHRFLRPPVEGLPFYEAVDKRLIVGNPDIGELMWDGCVVTALSADLSPAEMDHDVEFEFGYLEPCHGSVFSTAARNDIVLAVLLWTPVAVLIILGIVTHGHRKPGLKSLCAMIVVTIMGLLGALITYVAIPAIPAIIDSDPDFPNSWDRLERITATIVSLASERKIRLPVNQAELERLPEILREVGAPGLARNPLTGEDMRSERSPGNYCVREEGTQRFFCFYDYNGREYRINSFHIEKILRGEEYEH